MRFIWVLIILHAANAANNDTATKEYLDVRDTEDKAFIWKTLFIKLNTMLSEIDKLGQGMVDISKRQDDHEKRLTKLMENVYDSRVESMKRQDDHDNRLTKLMENVYDSRVESLKRQQDQENSLTKILENVNEIREDAKKRQEDQAKHQTQLMTNVNASRVDANTRQLNQENSLTKLLENVNEIREDAKKRQADQEQRLTQLMANVNASRVAAKSRQDDPGQHLSKLSENVHEISKRLDTQDTLLRKSFNHSLKWTTIQRRQDGSVDFKRNWNNYSNGFGNPNGDFFMGLQKLHDITTYGPPQELMIILKDFDGQTRYAKYDHFRIGSEAEKYALLELGTYTGDAGNNLVYHKGHKFTTFDQDNDDNNQNCAAIFLGGWWFYGPCYSCYLNGPYRQESEPDTWGVNWNGFRPWNHSLKYAEMMIRAKM